MSTQHDEWLAEIERDRAFWKGAPWFTFTASDSGFEGDTWNRPGAQSVTVWICPKCKALTTERGEHRETHES